MWHKFLTMSKTTTLGPKEQRARQIMGARFAVSLSDAGSAANLKVTNVTYGVVAQLGATGNQAIKDIYNLNAYKRETVMQPEFGQEWAKAVKLEQSGAEEEAEKLFNDLLNRCQLTFGQINNDGMAPTFSKGEIVKCTFDVAEAKNRDFEGNVIEGTHSSVIISSMSPIHAKVLRTKGFDFDALIQEEPEEELQAIAKPAAAKKAATAK